VYASRRAVSSLTSPSLTRVLVRAASPEASKLSRSTVGPPHRSWRCHRARSARAGTKGTTAARKSWSQNAAEMMKQIAAEMMKSSARGEVAATGQARPPGPRRARLRARLQGRRRAAPRRHLDRLRTHEPDRDQVARSAVVNDASGPLSRRASRAVCPASRNVRPAHNQAHTPVGVESSLVALPFRAGWRGQNPSPLPHQVLSQLKSAAGERHRACLQQKAT
jgi:hypothetical protein